MSGDSVRRKNLERNSNIPDTRLPAAVAYLAVLYSNVPEVEWLWDEMANKWTPKVPEDLAQWERWSDKVTTLEARIERALGV